MLRDHIEQSLQDTDATGTAVIFWRLEAPSGTAHIKRICQVLPHARMPVPQMQPPRSAGTSAALGRRYDALSLRLHIWRCSDIVQAFTRAPTAGRRRGAGHRLHRRGRSRGTLLQLLGREAAQGRQQLEGRHLSGATSRLVVDHTAVCGERMEREMLARRQNMSYNVTFATTGRQASGVADPQD